MLAEDWKSVVTAYRRKNHGYVRKSWVSALEINDAVLQKQRTLDIIAGRTLYILSSLKTRLHLGTR
jgi:hypothetical protein